MDFVIVNDNYVALFHLYFPVGNYVIFNCLDVHLKLEIANSLGIQLDAQIATSRSVYFFNVLSYISEYSLFQLSFSYPGRYNTFLIIKLSSYNRSTDVFGRINDLLYPRHS